MIQAPVKKSNYYHSRILSDVKKNIKLTIPYCVLKHFLMLSNKQGFLLYVRVLPDDFAKEQILKLEENCISEMITHNAKWFRNGLEEGKIRDMFESCLEGDVLRVYVSPLRSTIQHPEMLLTEWLQANKTHLPKNITITITCDGMFIYPTKFGLRWIIQEMKEFQEEEDISPEAGDILEYWEEKAISKIQQLQKEKESCEERMKKLQEVIDKIQQSMNKMKKLPEISLLEQEVAKLKNFMEEKTFL
jgi:hypothetical protein